MWNLQNLVNLLWSMAVLQKTQHPAFAPVVRLAAEHLTPSRLARGIVFAGRREDHEGMSPMFQVDHSSEILPPHAWWYRPTMFCLLPASTLW